MRKLMLLSVFLGVGIISQAQKKAEIEFEVSGVCGMCEDRIEKALDVPGIISAKWDKKNKKATVAFKPKVLTEAQIHQLVADAGHDTDKIKATDEVYNNLHGCCKYRDGGSCAGENDHDHSPK